MGLFNRSGLGSLGASLKRPVRRRRWTWWLVLGAALIWLGWFALTGRLSFHWNLYMARSCTLQGRYNDALTLYEGLRQTHPNEPRLDDGVGLVYLYQGLFDQAQDRYNSAMKQGLTFNRLFNHITLGRQFM